MRASHVTYYDTKAQRSIENSEKKGTAFELKEAGILLHESFFYFWSWDHARLSFSKKLVSVTGDEEI